MRAEDAIGGAKVFRNPDGDGFLPDTQVDRSANHAKFTHLCELLLDKPDLQHRHIHAPENLSISSGNFDRRLIPRRVCEVAQRHWVWIRAVHRVSPVATRFGFVCAKTIAS